MTCLCTQAPFLLESTDAKNLAIYNCLGGTDPPPAGAITRYGAWRKHSDKLFPKDSFETIRAATI